MFFGRDKTLARMRSWAKNSYLKVQSICGASRDFMPNMVSSRGKGFVFILQRIKVCIFLSMMLSGERFCSYVNEFSGFPFRCNDELGLTPIGDW